MGIMEAIQDSMRQKLREVLSIYGLPDGVNGLFNEHILHISRTVHECRVEMGIDRDPPSVPMAINNNASTTPPATPPTTPSSTNNDSAHGGCRECRHTKRQSYVGMASAPKRRRKRTAGTEKPGASADPETSANGGSAEVQESSPSASLETLPSRIRSAGTADARLDEAPETLPTGIPSAAVEEHGSNGAPETLPNDTSSTGTDIGTDAALKTLSDGIPQVGVEEQSAGGATETLPNNIPAADNNIVLASHGVGGEMVPLTVSQPETLSNNRETLQPGNQTGQTFQHVWSFISEMLNPADAIRVMTSVLLYCAAQRQKAGRFGRGQSDLRVFTDTRKICELSRDLASRDFVSATKRVALRRACGVGSDIQNQSDECWYWDIISKSAKTRDPTKLPAAKGPPDDFSVAEKVATYEFMVEANYPTSDESQRQFRHLWKALFELQNAGVGSMLCYRTPAFDTYCKKYRQTQEPPLLATILSWEQVYGLQIDQLELRILAQRAGDFSGRSQLEQKHVAERLNISESSWNNASNDWYSADEETAFKLETKFIASSSTTTPELFYDNVDTGLCWNKSIFISLIEKSDKLLAVCPSIPVSRNNFLGVFSGKIRYSEDRVVQAIPGPTEKLWLDYSQVSGTLNQMQVAKPDGDVNVYLKWEGVNEKDKTGPCLSWRILVLASRDVMPFEQLVRAAPAIDQYHEHKLSESAKRGFTKSTL